MRRTLALFARETRAVAAVEFALLTPFVLFAMLGEFDLYRYVAATQRTEIIAESVAQMFAAAPGSPSASTPGNGVVTDQDVSFYGSAPIFLYPEVLAAAQRTGQPWYQYIHLAIAEIRMVPQGSSYTPTTYWHTNAQFSPNGRSCSANYVIVADGAAPSPTTLPSGVIGPNSIIAVDVQMTFVPTFGAAYLPSLAIARSVFMSPRNVTDIEHQGGANVVTNCP